MQPSDSLARGAPSASLRPGPGSAPYRRLDGWQWEAGTAAGLIPEADVNGCRWSRAVADHVASRREEIVAAVGTDAPAGGTGPRPGALRGPVWMCRSRTSRRWPRRGCCPSPAGTRTGRCGIAGNSTTAEQAGTAVAERQAWIAASVSKRDVPEYLGWQRKEFTRVAGLPDCSNGAGTYAKVR
jgi:hypothetical protein